MLQIKALAEGAGVHAAYQVEACGEICNFFVTHVGESTRGHLALVQGGGGGSNLAKVHHRQGGAYFEITDTAQYGDPAKVNTWSTMHKVHLPGKVWVRNAIGKVNGLAKVHHRQGVNIVGTLGRSVSLARRTRGQNLVR